MFDVKVWADELTITGPAQKWRSNIVGLSGCFKAPVFCIHANGQADLFQVAEAMNGIGCFGGTGEGGEQQRRKNHDDSHDNEQFD